MCTFFVLRLRFHCHLELQLKKLTNSSLSSFFSKQHFNHYTQDIDIAQVQVLDRGIIKLVWATNKNRVLHQCLLTFDSFPVFLSVQELSVIVWTQYYISCTSNYVFHIIFIYRWKPIMSNWEFLRTRSPITWWGRLMLVEDLWSWFTSLHQERYGVPLYHNLSKMYWFVQSSCSLKHFSETRNTRIKQTSYPWSACRDL